MHPFTAPPGRPSSRRSLCEVPFETDKLAPSIVPDVIYRHEGNLPRLGSSTTLRH